MSVLKHKYALLAQRELWEHRSLWMAPAIVGAAGVLLTLAGGAIHLGDGAPTINADGQHIPMLPKMFGQATMVGVMGMIGGVAMLVMFAYLLDCLYGERKDRSILFWKSLPVSDAETVLTKVAVAVVLVPLTVVLLSLIIQPLLLGAMYVRFDEMRAVIGFEGIWGAWQLLPKYAMIWIYAVLWYSPGIAWLLLASVLAKRAPLIYALMPPLVLILVEGMLFQGGSVARFIGSWLAPWTRDDFAWKFAPELVGLERGVAPGIGSPDWGAMLTNPSLWVGIALAAAMIYAVIRLRRYRDDT